MSLTPIQIVTSLNKLYEADEYSLNHCDGFSCGGQNCSDCILGGTLTLEDIEKLTKAIKPSGISQDE